MHLLAFLLFGLVIGALARLIVPGKVPGGWGVSLLVGAIGAELGGLVGRTLGVYPPEQRTAGWIGSLLGAIVVTFVYHAAVSYRARAR